MGQTNSFLLRSFVLLLLSSLFVSSVTFVVVQAVDKPSVPQFSVKLVDDSYWVPPTTSTDPYTGEITTISCYLRIQRKLEITVKNQPFTPFTNEKGGKYMLYYNVEVKGHFADHWGSWGPDLFQSNSDYTIITYLPPHYDSSEFVAAGNQIDIRVEAIIGEPGGWWGRSVYYEWSNNPHFYTDVISSGWSEVTFTVPERGESSSLVTPTVPSQTESPFPPETSDSNTPPILEPYSPLFPPVSQSPWATYLLIVIVIICIITMLIVITVYYNKQYRNRTNSIIRIRTNFLEGVR